MFSRLFIICFISSMLSASVSYASGILSKEKISFEKAQKALEPHKAIYDINLIATRSGSPIINISGKMFYEWKPSCEGWITNHRFNLFYEYADGPGRNDGVRKAIFSIPEDVSFDLSENTNFPMMHTVKMIQHMLNNDKFFNAIVFDGSDDEHSNGVISDMEVDYDDFSVSQQLIALEKIAPISCN